MAHSVLLRAIRAFEYLPSRAYAASTPWYFPRFAVQVVVESIALRNNVYSQDCGMSCARRSIHRGSTASHEYRRTSSSRLGAGRDSDNWDGSVETILFQHRVLQ